MIKNILMIPIHLTIGYIAIIICGCVSIYEMFTLK